MTNLLEELMEGFRPAAVYALVGESGTGKSFRSKLLAEKYGIHAIIDDGLLIEDDKILAGRSAKREKTYMGAVRAALFDDKEHRDEVAKVLKKAHIKKILILGTSEKMVFKIATRLQLPPPQKIIKIEDIATREEIEKAIKTRTVEGKHVIPVPSIEVKRSYPQIFSNSIKLLLKKRKLFPGKESAEGKLFEKSIVQPEFSKKGSRSYPNGHALRLGMRQCSTGKKAFHKNGCTRLSCYNYNRCAFRYTAYGKDSQASAVHNR